MTLAVFQAARSQIYYEPIILIVIVTANSLGLVLWTLHLINGYRNVLFKEDNCLIVETVKVSVSRSMFLKEVLSVSALHL